MNVKIGTPIEIALSAEDGFTTAKKLHEWLGLDTTQYSKWVQSYLIDNPFAEEGIDYSSLMRSKEFTSDYRISVSFAKKLAATAKSQEKLRLERAKSSAVRKAFIDVIRQRALFHGG